MYFTPWLSFLRGRTFRKDRRRNHQTLFASAAEALEDRTLLAVVTVTTTSDILDAPETDPWTIDDLLENPGPDGEISLREAILAANSTPNAGGPDEIHFNIAPTDAGHLYYRDDGIAGSLSVTQTTTAANDTDITDFDPDYPVTPHSWFRIQPLSGLPIIADPVFIDGYTQTGATPNTLAAGTDAVLLIEVDGTDAGRQNGLSITAGDSTVRGLVINNFGGNGIKISGNGTNVISGNYISTDVTGTQAGPNTRNFDNGGIQIFSGADANRIGTDGDGVGDYGERNVISGNALKNFDAGVWIESDENVVAGNFIGTDATGTTALENVYGVVILGNKNKIGTKADGTWNDATRNIISGNNATRHGYEFSANVSVSKDYNLVVNNYIGTDVTGTQALENGGAGVYLDAVWWRAYSAKYNRIENNVISGNLLAGFGTHRYNEYAYNRVANNWIGTDKTGEIPIGNWTGVAFAANWGTSHSNEVVDNTIAYNDGPGVWLFTYGPGGIPPADIHIHRNSIHSNDNPDPDAYPFPDPDPTTVASLGIDLGGFFTPPPWYVVWNGVTDNDPDDLDSGANDLQNFPVIASAEVVNGVETRVVGELNSLPNTTFTIDFYANSEADPSGYGEGEIWLGSYELTTDAAGHADFQDVVLPWALNQEATDVITATATEKLAAVVGDYGTPLDTSDDVTIYPGSTSEFSLAVEPSVIDSGDVVDGVLYVLGTHADDVVGISVVGTQFEVDMNGTVELIDTAGVSQIEVYLIGGNDTLDGSGISTPTYVEAGKGEDSIQTGSGNDTLMGGQGEDTLRGGAGNDLLGGGKGDDWLYGEDDADTLLGGDGDDQLDGGGEPGDVTISGAGLLEGSGLGDYLDGQDGSDTYTVALDDSSGWKNVTDSGSSGTDVLTVNGTSSSDSLLVTAAQVSSETPDPPQVDYTGIEDVVVDAGGGDDTITIDGSQTTILGGAGSDTIVVLANGPDGLLLDGQEGPDSYEVTFGNLQGPVTIAESMDGSADSLTINGSDGEDVFVQNGTQITSGGQTVNFSDSIASVAVVAGEGDQFVVEESSTVPIAVSGLSEFVINGTSGDDVIEFTPGSGADEIVAKLNGSVVGIFSGADQLSAYGLAGNDRIHVAGSIHVAAWLYGGEGDDELQGGAGDDVLLAGTGNDKLHGKNGRDMLVGGPGVDDLVGNAGDDILIGGYVDFGLAVPLQAAIDAIMAEWSSVARDFTTRQANLIDGSGSPDRLNGEFFLVRDETVFDDGDPDKITGSSGKDWSFADEKDKVTGSDDKNNEKSKAIDQVLSGKKLRDLLDSI